MIGKLVADKKAQWEQHLPELLQVYNSMQSVVTSYSPHYLMFGRCPRLPVDFYFLTMGTHACPHQGPAYVEEVRKCFKEAYTEAQHQSNCKADWQKWCYVRATSTMQLMPGDIMLMKADTFQGKRKDKWSEVEYVVVLQVTDDIPTFKGCDGGRNVKTIHHNQLFLEATSRGEATPLRASKSLSEEGTTWSTLAELTLLEWESKAPESNVDEAATLCLASHIPLGWVDGMRPTLRGLGAGDGTWGLTDEEVH